jgi:hypothetical protein
VVTTRSAPSARARGAVDNQFGIAGEIAGRGVDLQQCDSQGCHR